MDAQLVHVSPQALAFMNSPLHSDESMGVQSDQSLNDEDADWDQWVSNHFGEAMKTHVAAYSEFQKSILEMVKDRHSNLKNAM